MYGQLIQDFFGRAASWAAGSAAAVIMLVLTVALVAIAAARWSTCGGCRREP